MGLVRDGPGVMLRDLQRADPKAKAVIATLQETAPDIVLLTGIDWDYGGALVTALSEAVGLYPHHLALRPNAGLPSGLDLDGDGRLGGPGDALGFGSYTGQGGMALLSRQPITLRADHTALLWADLPGALLYEGMSAAERDVLPLFPVGLWEVETAGLHLIALSAGPPVFDGPEDRNGRRNHDGLVFAADRAEAAPRPVIVLGNANLDPVDGEGLPEAIEALLTHPRLQDPKPRSTGGLAAANPEHRGDPALDTVDWEDPKPGNLRVSYVLPDAQLQVTGAGVAWPGPEDPVAAALLGEGPRHRLVWVDVVR